MKIRVSAPARLHLGDIDPFGIGRFGYAPILALDKPKTIVEASQDNDLQISGLDINECRVYAKRILKAFNLPGAKLKVLSRPNRHVGFGSTTQLALSIGKAITLAYDLEVNSIKLAQGLKRTSTGGLHTFQRGGFVVAGGFKITQGGPFLKRKEAHIPPLIFRANFPTKWRFLIVTPSKASVSPYGEREEELFKKLQSKKLPSQLIYEAYFTLMSQLIPSVTEKDAETFGKALTKIQYLVGQIYSPVQGGTFNPDSTWVISILRRDGVLGVGQSSWGPTVFAFIENEKRALEIKNAVKIQLDGKCDSFVAQADNTGATTSVV